MKNRYKILEGPLSISMIKSVGDEAVLFALEDYIAKGLKDLPEDQSRTERLCQWNKPAKRKFEPQTIHNLKITRQEHGKVSKERQTLESLQFDPRHPDDRLRNEESFAVLRATLLSSTNSSCSFSRYNQPILHDNSLEPELHVTCISEDTLPRPPSVQDLKDACGKFKETLHLDASERKDMEEATRAQSSSALWHTARKHLLTASNFHKISVRRKDNPTNLVDNLLYSNMKPTKAMTFGLQQEENSE